MPLQLPGAHPSLLLRRDAFGRAGLARSNFDSALGLTADEFRVEGGLIVVGPIHDADAFQVVVAALEEAGLVYFEDFFDFSGTWPEWIRLFATGA